MTASNSLSPAPAGPATPAGFALPGRLLVGVVFMTQFMVLIAGLGGVVPTLHQEGVSSVVLALGTVAVYLAMQAALGLLMRRIPVRCTPCGGRSYFAGFGWWPFIYRFNCAGCGLQCRIEVGRR